MDLSKLFAARNGLPTERQAARTIATFAVIPAAMLGLLAGNQLVPAAAPMGRHAWVCTATACGAGFGVLLLVSGVYRLFGFRPLAVLADALAGGLYGLLGGGALTMSLMALELAPRGHELWPLLLIPLSAVAFPIFRAWRERGRARDAVERAG